MSSWPDFFGRPVQRRGDFRKNWMFATDLIPIWAGETWDFVTKMERRRTGIQFKWPLGGQDARPFQKKLQAHMETCFWRYEVKAVEGRDIQTPHHRYASRMCRDSLSAHAANISRTKNSSGLEENGHIQTHFQSKWKLGDYYEKLTARWVVWSTWFTLRSLPWMALWEDTNIELTDRINTGKENTLL